MNWEACEDLIPEPKGIDYTRSEKAQVSDILNLILKERKIADQQLRKFSRCLLDTNKRLSLKDIWFFVRSNIVYMEDGIELYKGKRVQIQRLKWPSKLWADKQGDCKSITLFVGGILQGLKVRNGFRLVFYTKKDFKLGRAHIYNIAKINGQIVTIDATRDVFNQEMRYYKKSDYWQ